VAARTRIVARPVDLVQVKGKNLGVTVYEPLCLESDDDPQSHQIAALSEEAFAAYRARQFQQAAAFFARVRSIRPDDRASSVLEARCRVYLASAPPENWTGVHVATEK
jgi:adenylate cyclase